MERIPANLDALGQGAEPLHSAAWASVVDPKFQGLFEQSQLLVQLTILFAIDAALEENPCGSAMEHLHEKVLIHRYCQVKGADPIGDGFGQLARTIGDDADINSLFLDRIRMQIGQFCHWAERRELELTTIAPIAIAAYIEELTGKRSAPTVKQHLASIRMLFDWLVTGQIIPTNPAASVRGPKHVVKKGKTPVLAAAEARQLLDSIDTSTLLGLRDRALIALMCYSFARVSAAAGMNVEDYYQQGKRSWLRLHEKGGKFHEVPAHHNAEEYLDAYVAAAGIADQSKTPLFRSAAGRNRPLSSGRMSRTDILRMVKSRGLRAGIAAERICCHTFRATGITAYLENGGSIDDGQSYCLLWTRYPVCLTT
jgi:site-specific recombinase XerD